ncbi:MAG: putative metal-binding motif-containing protein [Myxococcales bacterium]
MRGVTTCGAALCLLFGLGGCELDFERISIPALIPLPPADAGLPPIPEGAWLCDDDRDCDDGVQCTRDVCAPGGFCVNSAQSARCSDGVFCNGVEVCDPLSGCEPGFARNCDDGDVCTIDSCSERDKRCEHAPRDFDDDGEVDYHCAGGTDCDDFDATRSAAAPEVCGDTIDNDCDDVIDERDCGRVGHDVCDTALDVSAGGVFDVTLQGAAADYALGCAEPGKRDVVFTFELEEPRDVSLIARGLLSDGSAERAFLALRERCQDSATELECRRGVPGVLRRRALPAGRYFVLVSSDFAERMALEARFAEPSEAPENQSCDSPLDVTGGGRFEGDFVDVSDDERLPCGFVDAEDLIYSFTLDQEQDVEVSALGVQRQNLRFALRTSCKQAETTQRCVNGQPARARFHQLSAGTYYLVLEGSPSQEMDFTLDVAVLPPSPAPRGDSCADPLDLDIGVEQDGTLVSRQDLVHVLCGCEPDALESGLDRQCGDFMNDVVYRVNVPEPMDLGIRIDGGDRMGFDLRSVCADRATQLACIDTPTARVDRRVRDLTPGEYFLIVESQRNPAFVVELEQLPRTIPEPVTGNGRCETATIVPPEGGLYVGDTRDFQDDYQAALCGGGARSSDGAFLLELTRRSRVTARLEAVHDTVLYRFEDTGEGPAACEARLEDQCNDDDGMTQNSLLTETLDPGRYYYVVDGFAEGNEGEYILEISVDD